MTPEHVELETLRLKVALIENGSTPNQALIDDIERWRRELSAFIEQQQSREPVERRRERIKAVLR